MRVALPLAGGLVAGGLDLTFACTFWALKAEMHPKRIFQSVAAGVLGREAYTGGAWAAALGLGLHFLIAIAMSFAYYFAAMRWNELAREPWLWGAGYGLFLFIFMRYGVVPLSAAGPGSNNAMWIAFTLVAHMVLVGIPIALFTAAAFPRPHRW